MPRLQLPFASPGLLMALLWPALSGLAAVCPPLPPEAGSVVSEAVPCLEDRCPEWTARLEIDENGLIMTTGVFVAPDGNTVYTTGTLPNQTAEEDLVAAAYDAGTGVPVWTFQHRIPTRERGAAAALSPDGEQLYLAGTLDRAGEADYLVVALSTDDAAVAWTATLNGPLDGFDEPSAVKVSPDGARVFVTGKTDAPGPGHDWLTAAYAASSGALLWSAVHAAGAGLFGAKDLVVSPAGDRVYVTGLTWHDEPRLHDATTIAYDAAIGAPVWTHSYNSAASDYDEGRMVGVSPDGTRVFVAGPSVGAASEVDYAVLALSAGSGLLEWETRYDQVLHEDWPKALAVAPDGAHAYVTGDTFSHEFGWDLATVSLEAATGDPVWVALFDEPGLGQEGLPESGVAWNQLASAVAASPEGERIYVTGQGSNSVSLSSSCHDVPTPSPLNDFLTVAHDAVDGSVDWTARYDGPSLIGVDDSRNLAVAPDGGRVYVAGPSGEFDQAPGGLATVAYAG